MKTDYTDFKNMITQIIIGKKNIFLAFFSIITLYLVPFTCLYPAFQDTGWGVRAGGIANSFTAISDDASAPLCNPAGISQLEMFEACFMYNKLFAGVDNVNLNQMYVSAVYPAEIGSFGITVTDFSLWKYYKENMFLMTYSNDFSEKIELGFPIIAGLSLKYLSHTYILDERTIDIDDPVFDKISKGAFTPDIGILLKPYNFSLGVSVLNILQPDIGLKTEDKVPMIIRFGTAYRFNDWYLFENITPTFDVSYRKPADNNADIKISGGIETWFSYHTFGVRMGGNDREITTGFSYNKTFGKSGFQIDYAFLFPLELGDSSGSHRISLTYKHFLEKR